MSNNFFSKNINIAFFWGAIFFLVDQVLKNLIIVGRIKLPIKILGDFFVLNFSANPNIAFSLPLSGRLLTTVITIIVFGLFYYIFYLILAKKLSKIEIFLWIILWCGALSNVIDRWRFGYVIDYFDLSYFTVFNVADVMISLSVVGLIYLNFIKPQK
jgi:signal peptidase II